MRKRRQSAAARPGPRPARRPPVGVRIIAGRFRGRKLHYSGELRTRPMKDRLRQSLFDRLGDLVQRKHAIDLFAGTGALALEALSRGAARAPLVEHHRPTAEALRRNVASLGVEDVARVIAADAFVWFRRGPHLGPEPWLVFCSPPYDFYVERREEMIELVGGLIRQAPEGSVFVVEADERFDFAQLPDAEGWELREMRPAVVGMYEVQAKSVGIV